VPADHSSDIVPTSWLDRSTCRVAQHFASMSATVLGSITVDHKKMPTEHLCLVAAALNIPTAGWRNLRFKARAAIRKHFHTVDSARIDSRSSASVAEFLNSFDAHRGQIFCPLLRIPT
jgi:hypothetical protein